ncbi:type II secretion system F family protein [Actinophytocola gossypii]|uniref:Type II secretion system F family protein n=1 Tax=Actinophytocola gossypii TaxID=2812003 RepID=A0ABT2J3Z2_9PSEU|nr:type II secretion system F family protein [Actinophytocola gossypii]MCT2582498.1 type II secretion system F family protein [Actinophytocola gossypii]
MVTAAVLCLAFLTWPPAHAARRLHTLTPTRGHRWHPPRPSAVTLTCAAAAAGWLVAGLPGAAAAAVALVTLQRRWHARQTRTRSLTATAALAEAVHSLVAALRTGAHPADAAESAATDAPPSAAGPMRAVAAVARLNGDITQALSTAPPVQHRIARAWSLAQRHGLPLADVLEAVARDLDQRVRFTRQVLARMAGPRTSATVLAALPALGIALGEAMGAHPLHVLTTTPLGGALLVVGVAFLAAGITWTARLTTQAVPQ